MKWLREELTNQWDELETRKEFERRTGITAMSLSGHFTRYADRKPRPAARKGKQLYFVGKELDAFIAWIQDNPGPRSDAEIRRAEIARLTDRIEEAKERRQVHEEGLEKADRDLKRFERQLRRAEEDLKFFERTE